ncbi:MAG: putative zinc-binding protein [Candidatus Aminicenantes bacterium]|nr:putative zinc-binding protein [Candidatus Aminicenantes bacterium]
MPKLPEKKAGIIACSGEELAEGTVSRLAALKVLNETRRGDTVTLCLPLFLAGGEGERTFARFYPTITVDGCDLKCAAKATERYSAKPAASLVVTKIAEAKGITGIEGRSKLNDSGKKAVEAVARVLEKEVDRVLNPARFKNRPSEPEASPKTPPITCSCGSKAPFTLIQIAGRQVAVVALRPILDDFLAGGSRGDEAGIQELFNRIAVYNRIPAGEENAWKEALRLEIETRSRKEKR